MKKTKILITRMGNIGDMLFITPLLSNIKKHIPNAQIYLLCPEYSKETLLRNPYIDYLFTFHTKTKKFINKIHNAILFSKLKNIYFDFLLCLDTDKNVISFVKKLPRIKIWIGFCEPAHIIKPWDKNVHAADNYLSTLKEIIPSIDIKSCQERFSFHIPQKLKDKVESFLTKNNLSNPILLCPSASQSKPHRFWPTENWILLIQKILNKTNLPIIVISRTSKEKPIPELYKAFSKKIYFWHSKTLTQTAALMSLSKIIVCLDTGTLHLATATSNSKIISLFGPSDPIHTGPYPKAFFKWKVIQYLPCSIGPCNMLPSEKIPQRCLLAEFTDCMHSIAVDTVLDEILLSL